MKTLRLLAVLLLTAAPLSAQQASDRQLRQRTGFAIARVENSIEEMEALLAHVRQLYDDLHARITADSLAAIVAPPADTVVSPPPPPDTVVTPPPPPPDTTSPPPPPPSAEFPNRPDGFVTVLDEKFEAPWSGSCPSGWTGCSIWQPSRVSIVDDPTAPPFTGTRALRTSPPLGATPGGALTMNRPFGASYDAIYISYWVKFEAGYQFNGNSDKLFNIGRLDNGSLFEYHWNTDSFRGVRPATRADSDDANFGAFLHANLMPKRSGDGVFNAPPPTPGTWGHYEFVFDKSAGRVQWWLNGVQRADHRGVDLSNQTLSSWFYNDTWGGGGNRTRGEGRLSARLYIAGRR